MADQVGRSRAAEKCSDEECEKNCHLLQQQVFNLISPYQPERSYLTHKEENFMLRIQLGELEETHRQDAAKVQAKYEELESINQELLDQAIGDREQSSRLVEQIEDLKGELRECLRTHERENDHAQSLEIKLYHAEVHLERIEGELAQERGEVQVTSFTAKDASRRTLNHWEITPDYLNWDDEHDRATFWKLWECPDCKHNLFTLGDGEVVEESETEIVAQLFRQTAKQMTEIHSYAFGHLD